MIKKKNKKMTWVLPVVIVVGIIYSYCIYLYEKKSIEKAPKIDFEHSIDSTYVQSIEFPRNAFYFKTGIYLNDTLYDTFINHGSQTYGLKEVIAFRNLLVPFVVTKNGNNDTLHIVKDNKKYYLLISEEMERRRNQF